VVKNILVVCVGNICRSPMAEALLRQRLGEGIKVHSAGIGALVGHEASAHAQDLMRERGLDISGHRARQLGPNLLREADLVLVMEAGHKAVVDEIDPTARGKVFRLGEWRKLDVPDPYRQSRVVFEECLGLIEEGVGDWVAKLR